MRTCRRGRRLPELPHEHSVRASFQDAVEDRVFMWPAAGPDLQGEGRAGLRLEVPTDNDAAGATDETVGFCSRRDLDAEVKMGFTYEAVAFADDREARPLRQAAVRDCAVAAG